MTTITNEEGRIIRAVVRHGTDDVHVRLELHEAVGGDAWMSRTVVLRRDEVRALAALVEG